MNGSIAAYQSVLAAVDLGDMTDAVLERATGLGGRCGAAVDVGNVLEAMPSFLHRALSDEDRRLMLAKGNDWSRESLEKLAARHPGIRETYSVMGILAEELHALADRIGSDLLLIGAHERHGMAILFRDRSDEILHKSGRDTLIVKRPGREAPPYRHVLAAVDLGASAEPVAARAAWMASLYGASLTLLHVIDCFPVDRSNTLIAPEDRDPLTYERERAWERLESLAGGLGMAQCRQEIAVSAHKASREIPAFVADNGVDLVVCGSHGPHGLGRLLGSTADGIVHRSACDVLVVRLPSTA